MIFNKHSNLEGQHAFLGASKYHWINYSEDKVADSYLRGNKDTRTEKGMYFPDWETHSFKLYSIRRFGSICRTDDFHAFA